MRMSFSEVIRPHMKNSEVRTVSGRVCVCGRELDMKIVPALHGRDRAQRLKERIKILAAC